MSELNTRAAPTLQRENCLLINTHLQVGAEAPGELLKPLQRFFVCKVYRTRAQPEKPLKRFQNATSAPHTHLKVGVNEKSVDLTYFFIELQPPLSFLFHVS